jgi:hypothetical protein
MTRPTPAAVILACVALTAVMMTLRSPAPVTAQGAPFGQDRPNSGVPHREPIPPAVLALDINGQPTPVSPTIPVPVLLQTPVPVTARVPLGVNDGGQIITALGDYTFVFVNAVTLPRIDKPVTTLPVRVVQISGKWVTADYAQGAARMTFNTQSLLAIAGGQR